MQQIWIEGDAAVTIDYSCIQGDSVWEGEGNINDDPRFFLSGYLDDNGTPENSDDDLWVSDYYLRSDSPCIDAGTGEEAPDTDIDENPRPYGAEIDIGAYEYWGNRFMRGDVNADEMINIADPIFILSFIFSGGDAPSCHDAADANDDGIENIADAITALSYIFSGGKPPPKPFGRCGCDVTEDMLDCVSFGPCDE